MYPNGHTAEAFEGVRAQLQKVSDFVWEQKLTLGLSANVVRWVEDSFNIYLNKARQPERANSASSQESERGEEGIVTDKNSEPSGANESNVSRSDSDDSW